MPTAFVTGITGQDGSYLSDRLLADGWQVHGLTHAADDHVREFSDRYPGIALHEGDLASPALADVIAEVCPDEIYNLGGISSVAQSWERPVLTAQVTGLGAAVLLEAAWQLQHRTGRPVHVLQASSAEMFGLPAASPQNERTPLRPQNPYGAAKTFGHHLVGVYRNRGLFACGCILFNHESPRRPPTFVTRKITQAVAMIAAGKQETLALGNLAARRDWGWAPDYVEAMVLAMRHPKPADYVIATGQAHSVAEFVEAAFRHVGISDWRAHVSVDGSLARPVDAVELVGDAGFARSRLGWAPTVGFDEIVALMVDEDLSAL
jgi:GDPmannose 4,6-dehydratase